MNSALFSIFSERLSDVIPDRERGWIEMIVIELPCRVNSTAGRGLIIHDLFAAVSDGRHWKQEVVWQ